MINKAAYDITSNIALSTTCQYSTDAAVVQVDILAEYIQSEIRQFHSDLKRKQSNMSVSPDGGPSRYTPAHPYLAWFEGYQLC